MTTSACDSIDFSTVLASSIHDMKNSLAMLLGSLSDITRQCDPDTCKMHNKFNRIQHEAHRLNKDLVLLLTLYKLDQGQYFLNSDEVNMREYLEDIIIEYKDLLKGYDIDLSIHCDDDLVSYFDQTLISSIIKTIISNAFQYTKNRILITADSAKGYTRISITDNGPGYPDNMLYEGLPKASKVNFGTGSTGLGLYFSTRVAELHKNKDKIGYIRINNETNPMGGCFSIFLP